MSSSLTRKVCFNSNCKEASETWRNGWRRRTGDYAHLCDRCALAYEDGKFCETFHSKASGWRCCESCGKQIHCGCIVSFHLFVLLDAGGIECLTCAKKSYILTPNPAWPPPSHSEKMKDFSIKTWSSIVGSGPVPWRQAPGLFKESSIQSDAPLRMPFKIGSDQKQELSNERLYNGKLRNGPFDKIQNTLAVHNSNDLSYHSNFSVSVAFSSKSELDDTIQMSPSTSQPQPFSSPSGNPVGSQFRMDSSEFQVRNGHVRGDFRGHSRLLPRYRPQITDEELLKISSNSKAVITPLFEKTLSASDAGRIGRLVLPKKCAEAYFPPISHPEGLPLKVRDMNGKEWLFQFRFWPNNNSRMYVLEGITPCIQSMHLQAGDVVMFSRLEPEGKLVMGGRKASNLQDQGEETTRKRNGTLNLEEYSAINKCREGILSNGRTKSRLQSDSLLVNHVSKTDTAIEILEDRSVYCSKKKDKVMIVKSKRLRFDNDGQLTLTITEAQRLIRPQAKIVPSVVVLEGYEFEEFKDVSLVVGRPTIPANNHNGEPSQWVQCEDCCKWRKVPADALLPSKWICSENVWDIDMSSRCLDLEELAVECLEDVLPAICNDKKLVAQETDAQRGSDVANGSLNRDDDEKQSCPNEHCSKKLSSSPLKGRIDLNIQPEREEESPPVSAETFFRQQMLPVGKQMQQDAICGINLLGCLGIDGSNSNIN